MELKVDDGLRQIAREIVNEEKDDAEWSEIESDDMFQRGPYVGGYDATEQAFTFSYYDAADNEFWFQLTLDEIKDLAAGKRDAVDMRPAG